MNGTKKLHLMIRTVGVDILGSAKPAERAPISNAMYALLELNKLGGDVSGCIRAFYSILPDTPEEKALLQRCRKLNEV